MLTLTGISVRCVNGAQMCCGEESARKFPCRVPGVTTSHIVLPETRQRHQRLLARRCPGFPWRMYVVLHVWEYGHEWDVEWFHTVGKILC